MVSGAKSKVPTSLQGSKSENIDYPLQSEHVYRRMVEGLKDYALFLLTPEGIVASWNPGAERMKGYKASEIIGKSFTVFYPEKDLLAGKPQRELVVAAEEGRYE